MTEPKKPLSKQERKRKIKQIYRDMEAQKREIGLRAPVIRRGPIFYFVVLLGLAMIGGAIFQAADKSGGKKMRDGRIVQAERSVEALVLKRSRHSGWVGPYIASPTYAPKLLSDPWKHPYVYEPTNDPPVLLSLGPDCVRGTADDILPDPATFTKPFHDTTWTNDWVPFHRRGYYVVPSKNVSKGEK